MNYQENPPCIELECVHNGGKGTCSFLTETGGTDRVLCGWFKNEIPRNHRCKDCFFCEPREGYKMPLCRLKGKAIPLCYDACNHLRKK